MRNQFLVFVLFPLLSAVLGSFARCKIQEDDEMGRCLISGLVVGIIAVAFLFLGNALGGGK